MGRLTWEKSNGEWGINGHSFEEMPRNLYGFFCKLHEYEKSGLEPNEVMDLKNHQKSGGWIPCSERLPEESLNSVLGWDEYRQRCCFVQYYGGRWILGNGIESVKITAWQPVPEPYKS